eukprot:546613-Pyramimonas_sp.AAC.1
MGGFHELPPNLGVREAVPEAWVPKTQHENGGMLDARAECRARRFLDARGRLGHRSASAVVEGVRGEEAFLDALI